MPKSSTALFSQLHLNGEGDPENQNWGEDLETTTWTHVRRSLPIGGSFGDY